MFFKKGLCYIYFSTEATLVLTLLRAKLEATLDR